MTYILWENERCKLKRSIVTASNSKVALHRLSSGSTLITDVKLTQKRKSNN